MDEAMAVMDRGMRAAPMNGAPDHDFVTMMIPHHQGAIDMAKAVLLYTQDPELRNLALVAPQQPPHLPITKPQLLCRLPLGDDPIHHLLQHLQPLDLPPTHLDPILHKTLRFLPKRTFLTCRRRT
jgi:hypothetical protein